MGSSKLSQFQRFIPYLAIFLSLLLHLGIYILGQVLPVPVRVLPTLPVEIVYRDETKNDRSYRQMVTDPDLGKIEKEARDQARLLSQLTRRVKEELVARNNGPTKNRPPGNDASSPASKPSDKSASPKSRPLEDLKPDGLVTARQGKKLDLPADPSSPSVGRQVALGGSTNGEYLPFVKEGSFTSLNTDQFLYYTFFNRVNEQIRSRWVTAIREFSGTLSHADVLRLSKLQRETQIEVLLQPDGYLKGVVIGKPSGEPGLDQAAVIAFRKTAPFLNPPIEMKGEDGLVHLYYSFVIQWQPTFMVKSAQ